jgi:hypothetical protein
MGSTLFSCCDSQTQFYKNKNELDTRNFTKLQSTNPLSLINKMKEERERLLNKNKSSKSLISDQVPKNRKISQLSYKTDTFKSLPGMTDGKRSTKYKVYLNESSISPLLVPKKPPSYASHATRQSLRRHSTDVTCDNTTSNKVPLEKHKKLNTVNFPIRKMYIEEEHDFDYIYSTYKANKNINKQFRKTKKTN